MRGDVDQRRTDTQVPGVLLEIRVAIEPPVRPRHCPLVGAARRAHLGDRPHADACPLASALCLAARVARSLGRAQLDQRPAAHDAAAKYGLTSYRACEPTTTPVALPAVRAAGARFPPHFHPGDVHRVPSDASLWGTITFTFTDCNNGTVSWHSDLAGYNGQNDTPQAIQRLTQIAGTTCPP